MTATSTGLEALLRHYSGDKQLEPGSAFLRHCWYRPFAAEAPPPDILLRSGRLNESFGNKEFDAGIFFIDMAGFSELARGKTPREVSAVVCPFLRTVIIAATDNKCFVEKT